MKRIIGPYEITQYDPEDKITIRNIENGEILSPKSSEIARKIIRDYNLQVKNPNKYFKIEKNIVRKINKCVYDEWIEYLFIPDGTLVIDKSERIDSIKYVSLPNTLVTILESAFCGWKYLKCIEIPDSVEQIQDDAFNGCTSLERVKLPDNIRFVEVCNNIFYCCNSLKEIIIPDTITEIGESAFEECTKLEKIILSKNLKKISEKAFYNCTSLVDINVPNSIDYVSDSAFLGCAKLGNINIIEEKEIRKKIGPYELVQRVLNGAISVYDREKGEPLLSDDKIVKKIIDDYNKQKNSPNKYFEENSSGLVIKESVCNENIEYLFVPDGITAIDENININSVTYVNLPDTLHSIWDSAFCCWENLKEIEIPDRVDIILEDAFLGCEALEKVKLPNNHAFSERERRTSSTLNEISNGTFLRCKSLKEIIIPDTVEKIGELAFSDCEKLEKVILPKSLKSIDKKAFENCKNLTEINIPDTIEYIAYNAFDDCEKLENIKIPKTT